MLKSFKESLNSSSYLSFKTIIFGFFTIIILTGLFVGLNLTRASQDIRQKANEVTTNPCGWCGASCGLKSEQGNNCLMVMPPPGCECTYNSETEACVETCDNSPTPQEICEHSNGTWRQFRNGCADSCSYAADPTQMCTLALTMSCDCGPNKCWNGEFCESNPTQTLTYAIQSDQPQALKIIRQPYAEDNEASLTLKVVNQKGYEFEVTGLQQCEGQSCFYEFYPITNPKALNFWHKWKPTEQVKRISDQSDIWDVSGTADPYDQSWITKPNPCPGLVADFNQDCLVDATDRSFLINRIWGNTADDLQADISGPNNQPDNAVNIWDYSKLVQQWTNSN